KLWDITTGKELVTLQGPAGGGICMAITGDGKTVAVGDGNKGVRLWDVESRRERARIGTRGVLSVAFTTDDKSLIVGGNELPGGRFIGTLKFWNVATGKEQARLQAHGGGVAFLASTADGRTLASCDWEDTVVRLWEVRTRKERASFWGRRTRPAFSPDG